MLAVFNRKEKFIPASFQESNFPLDNPARGWYHIYPFSIASSQDPETEVFLQPGERLALVRISLAAFRSKELNASALARTESILNLFHKKGKMMILRFAYDAEGKGPELEPDSASLIKRHMEQLGGLLQKFSEDILVIQGIFVGLWGEMHGSRFLSGNTMSQLLTTLFQASGEKCTVAVRTPAQWRTAAARLSPSLVTKLALFNDGLFGSSTDLGTYGQLSRQESGEESPWNREEELAWQEHTLPSVPNGGEALACPQRLTNTAEAVVTFEKMHFTYLNSSYHPDILAHWKQETLSCSNCWAGCSGYEYIGSRLGYRLMVLRAELKKNRLLVQVENLGFAAPWRTIHCFLTVASPQGLILCQSRLLPDLPEFLPGQITLLQGQLPQEGLHTGTCLYLRAKVGEQKILFANKDGQEMVYLGCMGKGD